MITDAQRAQIRRLYFAERWKVGTIAAELALHHETVSRALGERVDPERTPRPSILDPYKAFVLETLEQHPRLRATRLFEMLRSRGYTGGVVVVRRFIRKVRPGGAEGFLRTQTLMGEQGQVDWASFGKMRLGATERRLSLFVMVLSWCRAIFARFMLDQSMESFQRGHVAAFVYFGGVPRTLLFDNLKSVVLERVGEHVRFNPRILELAGHYHFAPRACAPYRGNEKGKVERAIRYIRESFFAARRFSSLADLNAQLACWLDEVSDARRVPEDPEQRLVRDALGEERTVLLPLPEHHLETDEVRPVTSGKRPYVRFDGNDYSIPHTLVRKPLTLMASEHQVRIVDGTTEVARHARSYERRRFIEAPEHLTALGDAKRAARELHTRDRLRASCPSVDEFLGEIARRGLPVFPHTTRLAKLLDQHGAAELETAVTAAMSRGAFAAQAVAHLCDQRRRARGVPVPVVLEHHDPRVRDLRVTPHALEGYDALGNHGDDEEVAS